ncbi:predicted protein [Nematostella vectensis]|uniref:Uncharacterized protein n=1 Tax=Nematostella vectensis TaxID=45351 RepID=A7SNR7_NEMVE|nr:uncharacterized protein LOC5506015 [Nematostella vectensis]EDO34666.1 predicted protein [Nematostella vectensis]|eukprot:XP_001626766.1 predicted protein [Nematostella vectensis]
MGQLAVKLKELVERIEWRLEGKHEALSTDGSYDSISREDNSKQTSTDDIYQEDKDLLRKVLGKLELIETVVETQRNKLETQETKIKALKNTIKLAEKSGRAVYKEDASEANDSETEKDSTFGRIFDSIFQEKSKVEDSPTTTDILDRHSDRLQEQEEKLQAVLEKVGNIMDTIQDEQGLCKNMSELKTTLATIQTSLDKLWLDHDAVKRKSNEELETHQKLLDNLFSGFVVAFVILVFICMCT